MLNKELIAKIKEKQGWLATVLNASPHVGPYVVEDDNGDGGSFKYVKVRWLEKAICELLETTEREQFPDTDDYDFLVELRKELPKVLPDTTMEEILTYTAWNDDNIQFPRLLAEIQATVDIRVEDYERICESMDLEADEVDELFDRAQNQWERIKEKI